MCSRGRHLCAGSQQSPSRSTGRRAGSSVSHYALCALGVGMIGLGIVMIVWTVVPLGTNSTYATVVDTAGTTKGTTSSVAFVLVGSGVAMLLLSICLGIRHKRRFQRGENQTAVGNQLMDHIPQQQTVGSEYLNYLHYCHELKNQLPITMCPATRRRWVVGSTRSGRATCGKARPICHLMRTSLLQLRMKVKHQLPARAPRPRTQAPNPSLLQPSLPRPVVAAAVPVASSGH
ncbi:transmembrane protein 51b isoform X2 [Denticeps clupeoides]|uniref:transmembrane protein 51b isoform X2 n=1 Tax=Denticeps clupeoides TaxID=299321 RepID=UPI0010A56F5E|nr:uncharacterized protein LOC114800757 isoform X2 [Denticeps clupeoides]